MTREEAIKDIRENIKPVVGGKSLDMAIEALEQKMGEWLAYQDGKYHCSRCDDVAPKGYRWNFCPNCGADMGGKEKWTQLKNTLESSINLNMRRLPCKNTKNNARC